MTTATPHLVAVTVMVTVAHLTEALRVEADMVTVTEDLLTEPLPVVVDTADHLTGALLVAEAIILTKEKSDVPLTGSSNSTGAK